MTLIETTKCAQLHSNWWNTCLTTAAYKHTQDSLVKVFARNTQPLKRTTLQSHTQIHIVQLYSNTETQWLHPITVTLIQTSSHITGFCFGTHNWLFEKMVHHIINLSQRAFEAFVRINRFGLEFISSHFGSAQRVEVSSKDINVCN